MRPISFNEVTSLRFAKQNFCDCYLVSSIGALANSSNGRKILQNNIQRDGNNFCIAFNNVYGKRIQFLVKEAEWDNLISRDKYMEEIPLEKPHHPIIKGIEVAMNKLLKLYPSKKPFISKQLRCNEKFEYNRPSNFLEMFTGVRPITINEYSLKMSLKSQEESAIRLLNKIAIEEDSSFVVGTGMKFIIKNLPDYHCYSILKTKPFKSLKIYDHRRQKNIEEYYPTAMKDLKFICGYFNDMLK